MCRRSAARRKFRVSARTTKWRMRRRSMGGAVVCSQAYRAPRPAPAGGAQPLKDAGRFSRKAGTASRWSSVWCDRAWNAAAISSSVSSRVCMASRISRLVRRTACGGLAAIFCGEFVRRGQQLVGGHHARHQAPVERPARAPITSPVNDSSLARDRPIRRGSSQAPPSPGMMPELDEALGELGRVRGDADVAHAGQVQAGADGGAVDGGDHRHLQVEQRQRQALDAGAVLMADLHAAHAAGGLPLHVLDVAARREGGAGAGEDHGAHAAVAVDAVDGREEVGHGGVAGERVAAARARSWSA